MMWKRTALFGGAALAGLLLLGCPGDDSSHPEGFLAGECLDHEDNDGDGLADCDDPGCSTSPLCAVREHDAGTDADAGRVFDGDVAQDPGVDSDGPSDGGAGACETGVLCAGRCVILSSDVSNCGSCGYSCDGPGVAAAECVEGRCSILGCHDGLHDADGLDRNGCEYACHPTGLESCNGLDDDCDGVVPEDEADLDGDGLRACDGDCDDDVLGLVCAGICSMSAARCNGDGDCPPVTISGFCLESSDAVEWLCLYDAREPTYALTTCADHEVLVCDSGLDYRCCPQSPDPDASTVPTALSHRFCGDAVPPVCTRPMARCSADVDCSVTATSACIVCGDGEIDDRTSQEQCDDGNREDGDGCSSECQHEGVCLNSRGTAVLNQGCATAEDCADLHECDPSYHGPCTCDLT